MVVSPPFLHGATPTPVYDAQQIQQAMVGGVVGAGAYPVSQAMAWHGGVHLEAPDGDEPVRAIADGIVVFRRGGEDVVYDDSAYSTGVVVIRHETELGSSLDAAGTRTPVSFVYYSIALHLGALDDALPAVGKRIWRKDKLGKPGRIHGQDHRIHFEIVCGDSDLKALIGRTTGRVPLERDGRGDVLYGSAYVMVPRGAMLCTAMPTAAGGGTAAEATTEDFIVEIDYDRGDAHVTTWQLGGGKVGSLTEPEKSEYRLYQQALDRHRMGTTGASPSGWYEMLRWGRKMGPDPLPPHAPHWRRVKLPAGGLQWVDLNTSATTKFSDADFPHWRGWRLVDDDVTDDDSRCDSKIIERFLNTSFEGDPVDADTPQSRMQRLCANDVQTRLARTICKFPTEWAKADVETRWKWTMERGNPYNPRPLDQAGFEKMVEFAKKLCFWEDLPEADRARLTKKHWHFHPREFITHMRKCLWLSEGEMRQLLPKNAMRRDRNGVVLWEPIDFNQPRKTITNTHRIPLNLALCKWGINTPMRLAAFFGNSVQETVWWGSLSELGGPGLWYAPWYGRGFLQLTNPSNYVDYWRYRGRQVPEGLRAAMAAAYQRIYSIHPPSARSNADLQDTNFTMLTQEMKTWRDHVQSAGLPGTPEDLFSPTDSAGFYWAMNKMSNEADKPHILEQVSLTTNGGTKIYYRSNSFWRASAVVNLPTAVNSIDFRGLNGFDARCVAFGYALAVLTEMRFPDAHGEIVSEFPQTNIPRRDA